MKKKLFTLVLLTTLLFVVTACGNADSTSDNSSASTATGKTTENAETAEVNTEDLIPLKIGAPGTDVSNAMVVSKIALKQGYLEEELNAIGYTAEVQSFLKAGPEINEALAAESLDVAIYGDLPAVNNNIKGKGTTFVAMDCGKWKYTLLAAEGVEINDPKDLEGLNVIVQQGTVSQYVWDRYVSENGIDDSTIGIINSSETATLLTTGDADVAVVPVSTGYYNASIGVGTVYPIEAEDIYVSFIVCVRDDVIEEHPEIGVAFNKAMIRAYEDIQADYDLFPNGMATESISAEVYSDAFSYVKDDYTVLSPEITDSARAHLDDLNQWLVDTGILTETLDLDSVIDKSFYDQAVSELGK